MAPKDALHALARDWANGRRTIDVLWDAYHLGFREGAGTDGED